MRPPALVVIGFLALALAAASAHAAPPDDRVRDIADIHMYGWSWQAPPSPEALRACVTELEQLARRHGDVVSVAVDADHQSIVLHPLTTLFAHDDFAFPARTGAGEVSGYADSSEPEDAVIGAAILILRDHFPATQLTLGINPPEMDLAPARALYREATGRAASGAPGLVPFMTLVREPGAIGVGRGRGRSVRPVGGFGSYGVLGAIAVLVLLGFAFTGGGRGGGFGAGRLGGGYGSYYLFWLVAPTVLAVASAHPLLLAIVPVGLVARRRLPDPYLWLRRAGRVSSFKARLHGNPDDAIAQRQLAMLYLEQRKPRAARPLLERALRGEPDSAELRYLRGIALLGERAWQEALDAFIGVLQIDARFRYGDPYLRTADALARLGRWKDAEEALEFFVAINGSSLEGWYKLAAAQAHRATGGREASAATRRKAREVYAQLPGFQRRQQLGWYLRTFV